ncbi:hypothetical protein B0J18DRAFT_18621 [Chaetomium sp. MPI-SDFR-AT-0129]|nr:hypothetical protein B0J18DRAFT_18621 [Chaetomium sp. MPI-SDFR-AT-0129]
MARRSSTAIVLFPGNGDRPGVSSIHWDSASGRAIHQASQAAERLQWPGAKKREKVGQHCPAPIAGERGGQGHRGDIDNGCNQARRFLAADGHKKRTLPAFLCLSAHPRCFPCFLPSPALEVPPFDAASSVCNCENGRSGCWEKIQKANARAECRNQQILGVPYLATGLIFRAPPHDRPHMLAKITSSANGAPFQCTNIQSLSPPFHYLKSGG